MRAGDEAISDPVIALVSGQLEVVEFLHREGQVSFAIRLEREVTKILVLSAASYFEQRIVSAVESLAAASGDERISTLVRLKAVKRQYHTYFDWEGGTLGPFRTMFGDLVADKFREASKDPSHMDARNAFLEIGRQRNQIIHRNFSTFSLDGSPQEWMSQYAKAKEFLVMAEGVLAVPS